VKIENHYCVLKKGHITRNTEGESATRIRTNEVRRMKQKTNTFAKKNRKT